jgi:hypothetical protein
LATVLACSAAQAAAEEYENSIYLSVAARSPEGSSSIRKVALVDGQYYFGVFGGKEILVSFISSYPEEPDSIELFFSDGSVEEVKGADFSIQAVYLQHLFGLVLAHYPSGRIEPCAFLIRPAWRLDEKDLIPKETPRVAMPQSDVPEKQAMISVWWKDIVVPQHPDIKDTVE